jgi:hypothetical protein
LKILDHMYRSRHCRGAVSQTVATPTTQQSRDRHSESYLSLNTCRYLGVAVPVAQGGASSNVLCNSMVCPSHSPLLCHRRRLCISGALGCTVNEIRAQPVLRIDISLTCRLVVTRATSLAPCPAFAHAVNKTTNPKICSSHRYYSIPIGFRLSAQNRCQ